MRINIGIFGQFKRQQAFALPTVLIASVVLLIVLAVSVTATATVRETLKSQYYTQLAQVAGEAGVAMAKACLANSGNVPLWTDAKPLTPATDCSGNVVLSPTVKALVIGGGGSGGGTAGGGGAGGYQYNSSVTITATSYPITVGGGGAATGNTPATGNNGGNSIFSSITAIGGGGGGTHGGSNGGNGGSGGGGGMVTGGQGGGVGGTGSQGYNGGNGMNDTSGNWYGNNGGGGGAGGAGGVGANTAGSAAGGAGMANNITGSTVYYAGGGGGGEVNGSYVGTGGVGGGGSGQLDTVGTAGAANTGGGGGGGSYTGGNYYSGGTGGSGVVILAFRVNSGITATGGTVTTSGGFEIHKFTSSGTFNVTSTGSTSCPSDPRCSVTVNGNVRSSYSVGKPTVDSQGRAVTIPNNGYVEITRASNGAVWRTYKQPSVQAAVVPDLCSGNATAARGWSAAVKTTQQDSLAASSAAQTISLADTTLNAGVVYYRKDFNASVDATYKLDVYTSSSQDIALTFIDGNSVSTAAGSDASAQVALTAGCHTMVVELTNDTYLPRASDFTAALVRSGATVPTVVSDTTWRVVTGDPTHFSTNNYDETPGAWQQVLDLGIWNNTALPWGGAPANWASVSGDSLADYITTQYSTGGTNRPGDSYSWFRDTTPFTTATAKTVRVTNYCDDGCALYLDGALIMSPPVASGLISKSITIQPGTHTFGIRLYNLSSGNVGAFLFAAVDLSNNTVLARSSPNWDSTTTWQPSSVTTDLYSYDSTYTPTPAVQPSSNAKVLVVGGGGGGGSDMGGGGGGGGVIYNAAYPLSTGTYNITVGSGGSGGPAGISQVRGYNGNNSVFSPPTGTPYTLIRAIGGGGGGSEYSTNASPPGGGASAGGSAGCNQNFYGSFVIGLGYGSAGTPGCYYPTGGGGAGGPGAANPATGGVGVSNNILGTSYFFGGGGGGAGYTPIGGNGGAGGGGGGAVGTTTGGSGVNPGSPGGGGVQSAQTNTPGGNAGANTGGGGGGGSHYNSNNYGGNGGSGAVVVSFPTGSITVTLSGNYQDKSSSTPGFSTYFFYGSGSLTVNAIGTSASSRTLSLLAVAGGGGGGVQGASGGGGGGGVITSTQSISTTGSFPVTVGAGGSGVGSAATNGGNTSIFGLIAIGGGAGVPGNGVSGGSGGGSARGSSPANFAASGTPGQGNSGGSAGFNSGQYPAAGGGGAGGVGVSVTSASPGNSGAGGPGLANSISGASVLYGAGGGGGGDYGCSRNLGPGAGGAGGGGAGGNSTDGNGVAGAANTGAGGGGATQLASCSATGVGGAGGSGIVIISYLTGTLTATGGTMTTSGGYTVHTFTSNGTFTIVSIN